MKEKKCHQETTKLTKINVLIDDHKRVWRLTPMVFLQTSMSAFKAWLYAVGRSIVSTLYAGVATVLFAYYGKPLSLWLIIFILGSVGIGEFMFRVNEFNYYNIGKQK